MAQLMLNITLNNARRASVDGGEVLVSQKYRPGGLIHCRAVRTLGGNLPGALVRQGLMSSPPRRV